MSAEIITHPRFKQSSTPQEGKAELPREEGEDLPESYKYLLIPESERATRKFMCGLRPSTWWNSLKKRRRIRENNYFRKTCPIYSISAGPEVWALGVDVLCEIIFILRQSKFRDISSAFIPAPHHERGVILINEDDLFYWEIRERGSRQELVIQSMRVVPSS